MIEKISPEEAKELPVSPEMEKILSTNQYKQEYLDLLKMIEDMEELEKTPLVSGFPSLIKPPPLMQKRLEALLDKNWNTRAKTAAELYKTNEKEFHKKYYRDFDIIRDEYIYLREMIMRRSKDPKRADVKDIYSAFKCLKSILISVAAFMYDLTSIKSFAFSLLRSRLFWKPIKGELIATNPPRKVIDIDYRLLLQSSLCNATVLPIQMESTQVTS